MRKFKIKNRPKRKYTRRKQSAGLYVSFTRNATVGILPFLLLTIAFSANLIINLHPIDQRVFSNLRLPTFTFSLHDMLSSIQHELIQAFQTASKHHKEIKVNLPTIPAFSWSLPKIIPFLWYEIEVLAVKIATSLAFTFDLVKQFAILLNPTPLIFFIGYALGEIFQILQHLAILSVVGISHALSALGQWLTNFLITMSSAVSVAISAVVHTIGIIATVLVNVIEIIIKGLIVVLLFIYHLALFVFEAILSAIIWIINGIIYYIMLPFILLWQYMLKLTPVWQFLQVAFNTCVEILSTGIGSIVSVIPH